ncbi:MAG: HD domain-containing protein, partial [Candidatus Omnitrophica bacterium]|nr:HD domain-containing protein [Candidatus Omnitrophota bacterium]
SETKISYSALGGLRLLNEEESIKLYRDTISSVKDVYDKAETDQEVAAESENITIHVEKLVNQQCLGNNNILNLINLPTDSDFIYTHVVNVCILSVEIGLGLEYDKAQLVELGTIAVVHDIGMVKFRDLYKLPRKLSEHEYKRIKRHPEIGAEILEKFKGIYKKAISVVYQEHERVDGSGYPRGLRNGAINEYTKIIGVADVYEALTHSRPHRVKNYAPESLKQIINMKNSFEKKILKVLLERIGCPFSFGTYVKLNSREKGKIVKRNIKFPFRPIVEITYDSNGQMREKTKTIDLTKCPALYIAGFLKSEEI